MVQFQWALIGGFSSIISTKWSVNTEQVLVLKLRGTV